jgi:hypothetical protein
MNPDDSQTGLRLTEEEAIALLGLCMTSPLKLDPKSELALKKLANYCKQQLSQSSVEFHPSRGESAAKCELSKVGA